MRQLGGGDRQVPDRGAGQQSLQRAAFCPVTVKAYVDRVLVVRSDKVVAEHRRSFGRGELVLDPLHYLAPLRLRPGALDHGGVFKDWKLPAVFEQLRYRLEQEHGPRGGIRHYVRVLQLLGRHPATRVVDAIGRLWHRVHLRAEDLEHKMEWLAAAETPVVKNASPSAHHPGAPGTHVVPPDLRRFNQLLPSYTQGEKDEYEDDRTAGSAAAAQPQSPSPADDAERVRQALA